MPRTLQRVLAQAEQALREAGVDSPEFDARLLAQEAFRLTHAQLIAYRDELIPAPLVAELRALVARRVNREPLAYVLGHTEFFSRRFLCDRRALVPRPETELLVEAAREVCRTLEPGAIVADMGLGTGVIACALALECPHLSVWGTEVSPAALQLARANAAFHHLTQRVTFTEGSLLSPLREAGVADQVAVLVSNPPYVCSHELAALQPEVSHWEPRLALDGGPEGLDVYESLLAECALLPRLQAVFLEIGCAQAEAVCALARRTWPTAEASVAPDLAGLPRVVSIHPQAAQEPAPSWPPAQAWKPALPGEVADRVAVGAG